MPVAASTGLQGVRTPAAERLRTLAVEVITELVDPLTRVGRCDVVCSLVRRSPW